MQHPVVTITLFDVVIKTNSPKRASAGAKNIKNFFLFRLAMA
jgi:hypothetical protein